MADKLRCFRCRTLIVFSPPEVTILRLSAYTKLTIRGAAGCGIQHSFSARVNIAEALDYRLGTGAAVPKDLSTRAVLLRPVE
jgi:hypothetical protein